MNTPFTTKIWVLPGGRLPLKEDKNTQRIGDVGINLSVRAIVGIESPDEQRNRAVSYQRKTLFDFINTADEQIISSNIVWKNNSKNSDETHYILRPGQSVSLGLGVVVEIPQGYAWYVEPRSSTIKKFGRNCILSVLNANVPGDPGFRAEIWAELKNEGPGEFKIYRHAVLFQLVRHKIDDSLPDVVEKYSDLSISERGVMSNGHTTEKQ